MLNTLAQTVNYTYNYPTTNSSGKSDVPTALVVIFVLVALAIAAISIVAIWKLFIKAGEKGWKSIIPGYNTWVMAELGATRVGGVLPDCSAS